MGQNSIIGRIFFVHSTNMKLFCLRMVLLRVTKAISFEDLRTFNNAIYQTFKQLASAMRLLDADREWIQTLEEACQFMMPSVLRDFFVNILAQCNPSNLFLLWKKFKDQMCDDLLNNYRNVNRLPDYQCEDTIYNEALRLIDISLKAQGLSLENFEDMPTLPSINHFAVSTLIATEKYYYIRNLIEELERTVYLLNSLQKYAFDQITKSSESIALAVASSDKAALLLPGGRTAHSRLIIPIKLLSTSTLNLSLQSDYAELIRVAEIIPWYEAPMTHRHAYEALDRS